MKAAAQKGFTLVELAVVIAIIAILSAVAIPRFMDTTTSAEESMARDLVSQLNSAAAIWTAQNAQSPDGFDDFVDDANPPAANMTIGVGAFGSNRVPCDVSAQTINCNAAFDRVDASYSWNNGAITATISRRANAGGG